MLRHSSTIKRARQNTKRMLRNRKVKNKMKSVVKAMKKNGVQEDLGKAYSAVDKALKNGIIHANTAARKKSLLAKSVEVKAGKELTKAPTKVTKKAPKKELKTKSKKVSKKVSKKEPKKVVKKKTKSTKK